MGWNCCELPLELSKQGTWTPMHWTTSRGDAGMGGFGERDEHEAATKVFRECRNGQDVSK